MPLPTSSRLLATGFAASAVVHLLRPQTFEPLMPPWVPAHRAVVRATGVLELACAAGMAHPRTRRVAGLASAGLLVGFLPAHAQMVSDARRTDSRAFQAVAWGRLPLQVPMVRAALRAARS